MKRIVKLTAICLIVSILTLIFASCTPDFESRGDDTSALVEAPRLPHKTKNTSFTADELPELVESMDFGGYVEIESVSAVYISQEYVEELAYNSIDNFILGYSVTQLSKYDNEAWFFSCNDGEIPPFPDFFDRLFHTADHGKNIGTFSHIENIHEVMRDFCKFFPGRFCSSFIKFPVKLHGICGDDFSMKTGSEFQRKGRFPRCSRSHDNRETDHFSSFFSSSGSGLIREDITKRNTPTQIQLSATLKEGQ